MIDLYKIISYEQWEKLIAKTHSNSFMFLSFIEDVIGIPEDPKYAIHNRGFQIAILLALYTFSIEEHGKLLYLKSLKPNENNIVEIEYKEKFRDHYFKFKLAVKNLPQDFSVLPAATYMENPLVEPNTTTRLNIFFTDIDENGDATNIENVVDGNDLRQATWNFHNFLLNYDLRNHTENNLNND